jgi:hypothetical protein
MKCPNCSADILAENINIKTDIAQCTGCNKIFNISVIMSNDVTDGFDINTPPKGNWIIQETNTLVIGASTRSPIAFFIVPFMLVWSGMAIGGIYGSQIIKGEFSLFSSIAGIPFILGSIIFWSIALMTIWGKVELSLDRLGGKIFTGIGKIGFTKNFGWDEISKIQEKQRSFGSNYEGLQFEGKRRITFGKGLRSSRSYYLFRALQIIIQNVKTNNRLV